MSHNLKTCLKELKLVMSIKDKQTRLVILKYLSHKKCLYNALGEISMNIINKKIPLNKRQTRKLSPHAKVIKRLAKGVKSKTTKSKLILQSGGFLPWLLPIIATAVTSAIDLINK